MMFETWQEIIIGPNTRKIVSLILLEDVANADLYLWISLIFLTGLALVQSRYAFIRPQPVPSKVLPRRPGLQILFKQDDDSVHSSNANNNANANARNTKQYSQSENYFNANLPDSFAPLLSSSAMEIIKTDVTPDLLHALEFKASATFKKGKHIIPLNKDPTRPQLTLDLEENHNKIHASNLNHTTNNNSNSNNNSNNSNNEDEDQHKISVEWVIGSSGFTSQEDFSVTLPTTSRSQSMLKSAEISLNPPLPLLNVAPTLIHIPSLFQDNMVPILTRRLAARIVINLFSSFSDLFERFLWAIESKCKIHLSKVHFTPIYKGYNKYCKDDPTQSSSSSSAMNANTSISSTSQIEPQWSLRLSFSGKVVFFNIIPIPFFFITLPTFVIPAPHALLHKILTKQPLASGTINHDNINKEKILLAVINSIHTWDAKMKTLFTPPAVGVDLTLPGGLSVAVETMLGRDFDPSSNINLKTNISPANNKQTAPNTPLNDASGMTIIPRTNSETSLSTWHSLSDDHLPHLRSRRNRNHHSSNAKPRPSSHSYPTKIFDANEMIPWLISVSVGGEVHNEKLVLNLEKASAVHHHDPSSNFSSDGYESQISLSGDFVICRSESAFYNGNSSNPINAPTRKRTNSNDLLPNLPSSSSTHSSNSTHYTTLPIKNVEPPTVASILLFPSKYYSSRSTSSSYPTNLKQRLSNNLLQYDYAFEIDENSNIDAISLSIGASHPMLNGGTMITTVLESIYAHGFVGARENAILNPFEIKRKRNILRHLPVVDFTCGIQNVFIPEESFSYSDDGQNICLPQLNGGRMTIRIVGGFEDSDDSSLEDSKLRKNFSINEEGNIDYLKVKEGIKIVADFGVSSFTLDNECPINEFPELDILEGTKQQSLISGTFGGRVSGHLRPQNLNEIVTSSVKRSGIGPNVLNPLEAFEIDFSDTNITLKIKEATVTIGHRRVIFPSESTFSLTTVESVLDMAFEGKSHCDFCWDFQGSSPILQVTEVGTSPANVSHEFKKQVSLLIYALRHGRVSFHISSVGGIHFTKAATTREHKEGLYDWKFFNAVVSPDEESAARLVDVMHDKPTMRKLAHISKLINKELGDIFDYALKQVWRAKDILDQEEIQEAAHVIPGNKMARLVSLFLCGDLSKEEDIFPIIKRVTKGEGLDIVKVKELLREHLSAYDKWAPEIDRAVRWLAVLLGPMPSPPQYVENHVLPLSELPHNVSKFIGIPSAKDLYDTIDDKKHIPLDPYFSNLVSLIAPYMSLKQVEYVLQTRSSNDWQQSDLRRLRYVYSVKKKVLDISESYGGLSFLPQSFLVSVFVAEATRASLKARRNTKSLQRTKQTERKNTTKSSNKSILTTLRRRRQYAPRPAKSADISMLEQQVDDFVLSPAGRVASQHNFFAYNRSRPAAFTEYCEINGLPEDAYDTGDSLLGPQDVAILLQAGLASSNKESTVVQLNQRMLLDLMASQPNSFAIGVLCELGNPGGHGSPRALASALMALLELNQSSFKPAHRLNIHALLSSWTGIKIPQREWYLAGGRWARQSYYDALCTVAKSILEDGEVYLALKGHIQRVRHHNESDPLPLAKELELSSESSKSIGMDLEESNSTDEMTEPKLFQAILNAKLKIASADAKGLEAVNDLKKNNLAIAQSTVCQTAVDAYREAFKACQKVLHLDKQGFQADWFKSFYRRNYDALMVKSVYDNVIDNVERVREWLDVLRNNAKVPRKKDIESNDSNSNEDSKGNLMTETLSEISTEDDILNRNINLISNGVFFSKADDHKEQDLIDGIIDAMFYDEKERETIRQDPIVRLLISNPEGKYNFSIISAMGVITDGKKGHELESAMERLEKKRGVVTIRADTGTARSFEFNASKIEEAIETAMRIGKPFGLLGYSQGCANMLTAESLLLSGPPSRQNLLTNSNHGLVCRQLLFSAANSSMHGACSDAKAQRLIVMCEEAFKYQQGYFSRALISSVLEALNGVMDSAGFHKLIGGAQSLLPEGCRAFWREAQHLPHVPTCVLRGVMEEHTTPECLEMISNLLTKQSGSSLHDSQVHVYDAVGHPIYTINRNGHILRNCDMGGSIQATHHWSPLDKEVEFLRTKRDIDQASFECAKDRHVFPWVDVNARFGIIKYIEEPNDDKISDP